jgi:hypothetical protein
MPRQSARRSREARDSDTDSQAPLRTDGGRTDATTDRDSDSEGASDQRTVVVPDRLYKTVTVFTTLFAVLAVVVGFIGLDLATDRARAPLSEVDPLLALGGLGTILLGAAVYAFSTRFRAAGMGNAKDDTNEPSDND